jgi:predicted transcriptional regulator of viral defense system
MEHGVDRVIELARRQGLVRTRDLAAEKLPRVLLTRMVRRGLLDRIGRGLYGTPGRRISEHTSLATVAKKSPAAVICLLSALQFHRLTTQSPSEVWVGIPNKARAPRLGYPPLRIVRFSKAALADGVGEHMVEGVTVRVTNASRTVVDCFRYRNKIGLDVAVEALREARRAKRSSMDELWKYATTYRVANVMRPYMESVA